MKQKNSYYLLDSGHGRKLEKFGDLVLIRPCAQAVWNPQLPAQEWDRAHAFFTREEGNKWVASSKLPAAWNVEIEGLRFKIAPTDFGHVGIFPEHSGLWSWFSPLIKKQPSPPHVLNLFAYSGGATLAAAEAGARVCHLDASKGMVAWARENAQLNQLTDAPIRWIIDDVIKFLKREIRRGTKYDGIILDPPSFGRGSQGETFKIERDLLEILSCCRTLLSDQPLFVLLSSHTPGFTPLVMRHLVTQMMEGVRGKIEEGEMVIAAKTGKDLPSGSYARWFRDA